MTDEQLPSAESNYTYAGRCLQVVSNLPFLQAPCDNLAGAVQVGPDEVYLVT